MGNKPGDDIQVSVAGMEVLIFHRDNFSSVLLFWFFFPFFPLFFFCPSVFILQLLVVVNPCPFYPSPQLQHRNSSRSRIWLLKETVLFCIKINGALN